MFTFEFNTYLKAYIKTPNRVKNLVVPGRNKFQTCILLTTAVSLSSKMAPQITAFLSFHC